MKCKLLTVFATFFIITSEAQTKTATDSSKTLSEVIVKAYENNRRLIDVPAAVSVVGKTEFNRYNNTSIVPALNSNPGVRMEERSPGSYRLNIRGSSLRSPFGVRNVKIYYNDIPYTDPGGNTYFNQLGFYNFQSIEILKGPGSSLYGAGTGGVMLIRSDVNDFHPGASIDFNTASFNTQNINLNLRFGKEESQNVINYQHQTSDGYRDWTKLRRDVLTWDATIKSTEKSQLQAHFLFGDLFYQTPGALTKAEYDANPKAARPAGGGLPGSAQAHAAIYQKTFLAGFTYSQQFTSNFKNVTTLYGAYSQLRNPTTRNYGRSSEPHTGGRTVFNYAVQLPKAAINFTAGAELQKGFTSLRIYNNKNGNPDSMQTDDEINNLQAFVFAQASLELQKGWIFTAGASINKTKLEFTRLSTIPSVVQKRNYNNEIAPRIAVLKKVTSSVSIYASASKGFSPPTTAEMLPSSGIISTDLNAEEGINYEAGTRGSLMNNKFYFDVNTFFFRLKNTIVQRKDATGADYFVNAGSTKQNGIETYLSYQLIDNKTNFLNDVKLWLSHTWYDFHYDQFKQISNDYSGKQMPSVAPQTIAAGADFKTSAGFYANITYFYSDKIALNDANTDYASSYNLLGARIGYKNHLLKKISFEIFAGAENILNVKYSLGNDINAFGGRYYNAAPGRNYFAGISFSFN